MYSGGGEADEDEDAVDAGAMGPPLPPPAVRFPPAIPLAARLSLAKSGNSRLLVTLAAGASSGRSEAEAATDRSLRGGCAGNRTLGGRNHRGGKEDGKKKKSGTEEKSNGKDEGKKRKERKEEGKRKRGDGGNK